MVISKGVCLCANHLQLMFSLHEINHLQAVCANKSCPAGAEHLEEDALNREFAKFVNDPSFLDHGGVLPLSAESGQLDLGTIPMSSAHVTSTGGATGSEPTTDYVTADESLTSSTVSNTDVASKSRGLRTGSDVRISTSAHTIPDLSLANSRTSHTRVSHDEESMINTTPSETEYPRPTTHTHWSLINTILDYSSVSDDGDDDDDKHDVENATNTTPNAAEKYQTTNTTSKSMKVPTNITPTQTVTDWSLIKSTDEEDSSDTPLAVTEDPRVTTPIDTLTERSVVNTNSKYTTVYDAEGRLTTEHLRARTSAKRLERWPGGVTQDLQQRSLCPWKYVPNIDPDRYPQTLMEAECLSPDCACGLERSSGLGCERIYRVVAVLRRVKPESCTKKNGFVFERRQEQLAVACTCSVMPTAR